MFMYIHCMYMYMLILKGSQGITRAKVFKGNPLLVLINAPGVKKEKNEDHYITC